MGLYHQRFSYKYSERKTIREAGQWNAYNDYVEYEYTRTTFESEREAYTRWKEAMLASFVPPTVETVFHLLREIAETSDQSRIDQLLKDHGAFYLYRDIEEDVKNKITQLDSDLEELKSSDDKTHEKSRSDSSYTVELSENPVAIDMKFAYRALEEKLLAATNCINCKPLRDDVKREILHELFKIIVSHGAYNQKKPAKKAFWEEIAAENINLQAIKQLISTHYHTLSMCYCSKDTADFHSTRTCDALNALMKIYDTGNLLEKIPATTYHDEMSQYDWEPDPEILKQVIDARYAQSYPYIRREPPSQAVSDQSVVDNRAPTEQDCQGNLEILPPEQGRYMSRLFDIISKGLSGPTVGRTVRI